MLATINKMEILVLTLEDMEKWKSWHCQRPVKETHKVKEVAQHLTTNGGIIPGIIHLGVLTAEPEIVYLLDGQHRRRSATIAFAASCDSLKFTVRLNTESFETLADMGRRYIELNTHLVTMKPDDILKGLEPSNEALQHIRRVTPFVGYTHAHRSGDSSSLSMATVLRLWASAGMETPTRRGGSAVHIADELTREYDMAARPVVERLCEYLLLCKSAWTDDMQGGLWGALNLTLCAWLYRRMVLVTERNKTRRYATLDDKAFKACLMALSADENYAPWLVGRALSERDRSPCYGKIREIFSARLKTDGHSNTMLPLPAWSKTK